MYNSRLTIAATKEELLTMIQHGAEGIFTSNDR